MTIKAHFTIHYQEANIKLLIYLLSINVIILVINITSYIIYKMDDGGRLYLIE